MWVRVSGLGLGNYSVFGSLGFGDLGLASQTRCMGAWGLGIWVWLLVLQGREEK
jgi:hypothetical protein